MFGYVRAATSHLSENDKNCYSAFYCGLCKEMGRQIGKWTRMTLTFDATFLAILHASLLYKTSSSTHKESCAINPFRKVSCIDDTGSLLFASHMSALLAFLKVEDTMADERGFKKSLAKAASPIFKKPYDKTKIAYEKLTLKLERQMLDQVRLEKDLLQDTDLISVPSGTSLGLIMKQIPHSQAYDDSLYWFGYFLGRWVYLVDAVDDYDEDKKTGSYNVFNVKYPDEEKDFVFSEMRKSLNATLFQISKYYRQLPIKRYLNILDNIIYRGLPAVQNEVLDYENKNSENKGERKISHEISI